MFSPNAQGVKLPNLAVENSGWKLKLVGGAGFEVQALEAILGTGDHKAGLPGRQIGNTRQETGRGVLDSHLELVTLVHEQCLAIGSETGICLASGSRWPGRNTIHLNEGKVGRLGTVVIAEH